MTCYTGAEVIKGKFILSAGKVSFFLTLIFVYLLFIYLKLRNIAECELIERRRLLHFTVDFKWFFVCLSEEASKTFWYT